jgi:hypothetical protein
MSHRIRWAIGLVILAILGVLAVSGARAQSASEARRSPSVSPDSRTLTVDSSQLAALQADAKKMRVMLDQMRTNLGFVTNTTTPLKHQFELEIDMWQMLLDQMDRRIGEMEHANREPSEVKTASH